MHYAYCPNMPEFGADCFEFTLKKKLLHGPFNCLPFLYYNKIDYQVTSVLFFFVYFFRFLLLSKPYDDIQSEHMRSVDKI